MRCCHLPWVGSARGSRRALRTHSPRFLFHCPILRRQILGFRRRDVGEKPWGNRGRDRGGPALSESRAGPNRAGRSLDGAVTFRATDLPDGQISNGSCSCVSSPLKKNISVFPKRKSALYPSPSRPTEGRHAIVTVAGRDAVDASGASDEGAFLRTAKSCGPDAPTLASSS